MNTFINEYIKYNYFPSYNWSCSTNVACYLSFLIRKKLLVNEIPINVSSVESSEGFDAEL